MNLKIGIVGLPNVGKSTLFNALTNAGALAANYPFATIEPNTGIVTVPDERLAGLAKIYGSEKILPATVTFVDIAGLVAGANNGEGLGNKFLAHIRECDAIVQVVRHFENNDILHVEGRIHPEKDIEIILTELALADISTLEKRISAQAKLAKSDPKANQVLELYKKIHGLLESGKELEVSEEERSLLSDLHLLSLKPVMYLFNVDDKDVASKEVQEEANKTVKGKTAILVNAKLEEELRSLSQDDAKELLESYGLSKSSLEKVVEAAYDILGLQSYLTAGPKEVRAWTIKKGYTAPQAAGVIHTDFERGFIAAEVISYLDLVQAGSESEAKKLGKVRTEGKTYIMKPDDVVEFRFNV
jgi:GTP-binding protein YchF